MTEEQRKMSIIRKYAVFNEDNQKYAWVRLGGLTYDLSYFGTAVPEEVASKIEDQIEKQ